MHYSQSYMSLTSSYCFSLVFAKEYGKTTNCSPTSMYNKDCYLKRYLFLATQNRSTRDLTIIA